MLEMTDAMEVLLELEFLLDDLVHHPLKGASRHQQSILLERLVSIMATILRDITSNECLAHLELISSGDTT